MRLYTFGNFYFSSIQQSIQGAHSAIELFNKYIPHPHNDNIVDDIPQIDMLWDWSNNHKTMICLNGGMNSDLEATKLFFEDEDNPFPWSTFHESEEAMGGILSNVAVVLPERIYELSSMLRRNRITMPDICTLDTKTFENVMRDTYGIFSEADYEMAIGFGVYTQKEVEIALYMGQFSLAK